MPSFITTQNRLSLSLLHSTVTPNLMGCKQLVFTPGNCHKEFGSYGSCSISSATRGLFPLQNWRKTCLAPRSRQSKQWHGKCHHAYKTEQEKLWCSRMSAPVRQVLCDYIWWPRPLWPQWPDPTAMSFLHSCYQRKMCSSWISSTDTTKNFFTFIFLLFSLETIELTLLLSLSIC